MGKPMERAQQANPSAPPDRVPAALLVANYLRLRDNLRRGVTINEPHTPEIKNALVGAMASIWKELGKCDRAEIAVAIARRGDEPVTIEEGTELAELLEGDALRLRREAKDVAKAFTRGGR